MIKIIIGEKGTGKTGRLVDMANAAAKTAKGNVVFIDGDAGRMLQVDHNIRFINTKEFSVNRLDVFYGFLSGLIAGNYDTEAIYVDSLLELAEGTGDSLQKFIENVEQLSTKYEVQFVATLEGSPKGVPEFLKKYI